MLLERCLNLKFDLNIRVLAGGSGSKFYLFTKCELIPPSSPLNREAERVIVGWGCRMKILLKASVALLALATLSACGDGGGGGVASTPTPPPPPAPPSPPPPPPPPNTSLINLTSSESFVNDAATGSANFPKTGTGQTATATPTAMTVAYDLASKGYTLTVGSRSLTFLPSDIDAAQSNAGVAVYVKRNGTTTDSLSLTKPGTAGRFTYEFVGGGFWQRTTDGAAAVSGSFDAFSYGKPTTDAAVPRTGRAEYAIDVLGVETVPNNVLGITGTGTTQIDFTTGDLTLKGTLTGTRFGTAGFGGGGKMSSTANAFTGGFGFVDGGQLFIDGSAVRSESSRDWRNLRRYKPGWQCSGRCHHWTWQRFGFARAVRFDES
jgi:hypothetical protein